MLTTFKYSLKVMIRNRANLLWAVAFPLILSTLFFSMFDKMDELYQLEAVPVVIVKDQAYKDAEQFAVLVDALSEPDSQADLSGSSSNLSTNLSGSSSADTNADANADTDADAEAETIQLFNPTFVANQAEAQELLETGEYFGYILLDDEGMPQYFMDSRWATGLDVINSIRQGIVLNVLDRYIQDYQMIVDAYTAHPELLADPDWLETFFELPEYIVRGSVTANPPSEALRYYYAALAFSCMQMMSFGLTAIDLWKANTSALGARRALSGQSWLRSLAPTMFASWCLGFACVVVGFLYIRFGFAVSFGGKEPVCLLVLAVSTLVSTLMGGLLGSLRLLSDAKPGILAAISCLLSLFAGLYGPGAQKLGDWVAREMPLLSNCNPARLVYEAFFSMYFYDGYDRLTELLSIMAVMVVVLFVCCTLIMRRQRYKAL